MPAMPAFVASAFSADTLDWLNAHLIVATGVGVALSGAALVGVWAIFKVFARMGQREAQAHATRARLEAITREPISFSRPAAKGFKREQQIYAAVRRNQKGDAA